MTGLRIGHGYDVHRLVEDRKLILGGVEIPWERGLLGHSDADVLTHAVMDALTGAAVWVISASSFRIRTQPMQESPACCCWSGSAHF